MFVVSTGAFAVFGNSVEDAIVVGRHEGIHLADVALNFPSRAPEMIELMKDIKRASPQFFEIVNESSWTSAKSGGHSRDSSAEFFASTLHALLDDRGIAALRSYNAELLRRCAETFLGVLASPSHALLPTAPVIAALRGLAEGEGR